SIPTRRSSDLELTAALDQSPKGVASDAAETVDSNASQCHSLNTGFVLISPSWSFPHHSNSGQTDNLRKLIARLIARYRKFQASVIGVSARPRRTVREPAAKVATSAPAGVFASALEGVPVVVRRGREDAMEVHPQVRTGAQTHLVGDLLDAQIAVLEQLPGQVDPGAQHPLHGRVAGVFDEAAGEGAHGDSGVGGEIAQGQFLAD